MLLSSERLRLFFVPLLLSVLLLSCNKDKDDPAPEIPKPSLISVDPLSGQTGIEVTITGTGFSETADKNKVTFNGAAATVLSASLTELVVEVPAKAGDGPVAVSVQDTTMVGPQFNYVESYAVTTLAGTGMAGFVDGTGAEARFSSPNNLALDPSGNLYVADFYNHRIRKISPEGMVTTFAGSGEEGHADGMGTSAQFNGPAGLAFDASGNLYVTDFFTNLIRKITPAGEVTTLNKSRQIGFADGNLETARFNSPNGLVADASGNLYVADSKNHRIRKITPEGEVTTLAGSGEEGYADGIGTQALFDWPADLAIDAQGNIYVGENNNDLVRKITPEGIVTTLAGRGVAGYKDGMGTEAEFRNPVGLSVDDSGNVYVADNQNHRIRRISPSGEVVTLAGNGKRGFADGISSQVEFDGPSRVLIDAKGVLYVADRGNHRIRMLIIE